VQLEKQLLAWNCRTDTMHTSYLTMLFERPVNESKTWYLERKENDGLRRRGNFEKHLEIVEPHQRYYESLNEIVPGYTKMIEAENVIHNID
jgi:hypothetical protein